MDSCRDLDMEEKHLANDIGWSEYLEAGRAWPGECHLFLKT